MGRAPLLCCRPSLEEPELSCSTNKTAGHDGHGACVAELPLEQDGEDAHEGRLPGSQQLPRPMAGGRRPCSPPAPHVASEGTDLAAAPQLPPARPDVGQHFIPTAGSALLGQRPPATGPGRQPPAAPCTGTGSLAREGQCLPAVGAAANSPRAGITHLYSLCESPFA